MTVSPGLTNFRFQAGTTPDAGKGSRFCRVFSFCCVFCRVCEVCPGVGPRNRDGVRSLTSGSPRTSCRGPTINNDRAVDLLCQSVCGTQRPDSNAVALQGA